MSPLPVPSCEDARVTGEGMRMQTESSIRPLRGEGLVRAMLTLALAAGVVWALLGGGA
jgi:hypothetical protein